MGKKFKKCFVIMPFYKDFENIRLAIELALREHNINMKTVDDEFFSDSMIKRIYNEIKQADVVIADISPVAKDIYVDNKYHSNSNVMYELGFARQFKKDIILISRDISKTPFDLKNYMQIKYNDSDIKGLKKELVSAINDLEKQNTSIMCFAEGKLRNNISDIETAINDFVFESYSRVSEIVNSGDISDYDGIVYYHPKQANESDSSLIELISELDNKNYSIPVNVFTEGTCGNSCADFNLTGKYNKLKFSNMSVTLSEWLTNL